MCLYEQYLVACGDVKWGHFRQHCQKEYRTGERCGMKLVMSTIPKPEKCKFCNKIDRTRGRIVKEQERIQRWTCEFGTRKASIESSERLIAQYEKEIQELEHERSRTNDLMTGNRVSVSIPHHPTSYFPRETRVPKIHPSPDEVISHTTLIVSPAISGGVETKTASGEIVITNYATPDVHKTNTTMQEETSTPNNDKEQSDLFQATEPVPTTENTPSDKNESNLKSPQKWEEEVNVSWK